jgi:hypothetical protein
MGAVARGGRKSATFTLTNPTSSEVQVAQVITGCPCLTASLPRGPLAPSEKVTVSVSLDLKDEPDFVGNLSIDLRGITPSGAEAFTVTVKVSVRPTPTPRQPK